MRRYAVLVAATGALALGASPVYADDTPDCPDIGHQVKVGPDDPYSLDRDGDGVGCESFPGPATPLDVDDPSVQPKLAETGAWGPAEHPVRWTAAAGLLLVGGAGLIVTSARRKEAHADRG
jgi:hypothetical protein